LLRIYWLIVLVAKDINEIITKLGPWTVNLHLKDYIIQRINYKMGFVVVGSPVGEGQLNIPSIINKLIEHKKNNISAIIELWTPPEKSLKETIQKEENWAIKSINYLKNKNIE